MDREALRKECWEKLGRLIGEQRGRAREEIFAELIDAILRRLDRLETGTFGSPNEEITRPEARTVSQEIRATKPKE